MNLLNKIVVLLLLVGFCAPSFAAVDGFEPVFCGVFADIDKEGDKKGDKKEGDKKTEEEKEPDCE